MSRTAGLIGLCLVVMLAACASPETLEKKQKRAEAHFNIGMDALRGNQMSKAFDELMQADAILPNQPLVLDALANAWRLQGDTEKAEAYFKRALAQGNIPSIHTNYASLLIQMGRFTEAKREISITLEDPRYPKQDVANILLGDALVGEGALDEGIKAYRQATHINPNQLVSRLKEALVYENSGRYSYAVALYETLLREYPDSRSAMNSLIPLLFQQGEIETARHYLMVFQSKTASEDDRAWANNLLEHKFRQQ